MGDVPSRSRGCCSGRSSTREFAMRWPFFGGDHGDRPISINLPADISPGFAVFFRGGGDSPPGADALPGVVKIWLGRHATGPLRELLGDWVDKGMLSIHSCRSPKHRRSSLTDSVARG